MHNDLTRRRFLLNTGHGMGAAALSSLWNPGIIGSAQAAGGLPEFPNFAPKAKRAIYLFFPGGLPTLTLLTTSRSCVKSTARSYPIPCVRANASPE